MPTTLTGSLHPSNKDAIAWNEKGLIVYGCHCTLVFVDVARLEVFQTIETHKAAINLVCWQPDPSFLKADNLEAKCASSDISGKIYIWDVLSATSTASFSHANSTAIDMKWLPWQDANRDFFLALHSNNTLILWNGFTGEKIWEYKFLVNVFKFSVDSLEPSNLAVSSVGSNILFMSKVAIHKAPVSSNVSQMCLRQRDKSGKDSSFIQVKYHQAYQNLVFALFTDEIVCVETQSKQIIYSTLIDTHAPLCQILPCARRDAFFVVHFNGFVSFRVANIFFCEEKMKARLNYQRVCFSEAQRLSNRVRVMGSAICPVGQSTVALLFNSGKLLFYQLKGSGHLDVKPYKTHFIEDFISLSHDLKNVYNELRLSQYGLILPLCSTVTAVRIRPLDLNSTAPSDSCRLNKIHLAAIATSTGTIHLVNVFSGRIERDLQIHSCPVKCLEWGGNNILISAAYSASLSSSATVRNDLFATDIRTGVKKRIRQEADESPIELIRVSFYQCYLAISFRSEPLEIWELRSMRLLRRMSRRCPIIVDMAWSGKHHNFKTISDTNIYRENLVVLDNDNHLYHVVIKGLHVRDGKEVSTQWKSGATQLRCMVWKDDLLAFGDSAGRLGVWDLVRSQCRQTGVTQSTRGPILKCVFSRLTGDSMLAVQHPTSVVLWDTERLQPFQHYQIPGLSIIDVDMCGVTPIYIASDGMFRFAFDENRGKNMSVSDSELPLLLRKSYVNALNNGIADSSALNSVDVLKLTQSQGEDLQFLKKRINTFASYGQRLIFLYKFLGRLGLSQFSEVIFGLRATGNESIDAEHLSTNLQMFWSSNFFRKRVEQLTRVLLSSCKTEKQLEQGIEKCIIMGKNDLATYFLLNNDYQQSISSGDYRLNALRACLMSANLQSEESRCLVKLTATNLIASNFITDGIQLLFLISQGLDACKYLISQGHWLQSVTYSKMNPKCEFDEILLKYVDYLLNEQVSYQSLAIMLLASLSKWDRCRTLIKLAAETTVHETLQGLISEAAKNQTNDLNEIVVPDVENNVEQTTDKSPIVYKKEAD